MAVYVDASVWPFRGQLYCHMLADTLEELHDMAKKIGMKREWFQCLPKASTPHYDLSPSRRAMAVKYGAIEIDRYQMSAIAKQARIIWAELETKKQLAPILPAIPITNTTMVETTMIIATNKVAANSNPNQTKKIKPFQAFKYTPK